MNKFDTLLTTLQTAVIILSENLKIEYMNHAAENLFLVSQSSSIGKKISEIFFEEPDNSFAFKQVFEKKLQITKHDALLRLREEKTLACDYQASFLSLDSEKGNLVLEINSREYASKIKQNITLINNQKVTSQFARGMAHEIKNPLSGIKGAAQLLEKQLDKDELKEYTNIIIQQTERLTKLIDNILGPNTKPSFEYQNIHYPIDRVLALIETDISKNIKINKDFDPSIPLISFDLSLIEQALLNIIKNAQESLISNSTLDPIISVKTRISHQEYIGKTRYGTVCKIEIEDNGIGIPESIKDSIFFPMISGKEHGNGLGLAITQGILYQHSGSVECKSRPGRTIFTFMLPLKNSNMEEYFTGEVINAK